VCAVGKCGDRMRGNLHTSERASSKYQSLPQYYCFWKTWLPKSGSAAIMLLIQAKERALWARDRKDISRLPLHHSTLCLVTNLRTEASRFELLVTCQSKHTSGSATYSDIDKGLGIYPAADRNWIERLMADRQCLEAGDYKLLDVISRPCGLVTVSLAVLKQEKKSLLGKIRKDESTSPVRLPLTTFLRAGGDIIKVTKMLQRTVEGRKVLAQRGIRDTERRRRAQCKRYLQRTGRSQCEEDAVRYGISFRGSNNVYQIKKVSSEVHGRPILCCGRCSH
jgi:hypothetical protein